MIAQSMPSNGERPAAERKDVLIIGAGVSGIAAACRISESLPHLDFLILESREQIGGTWDLFRYPGIRTDSDMFTYSLPTGRWSAGSTIVSGSQIRDHLATTAQEHGVNAKIRFSTRVRSADFDSDTDSWTVVADHHGTTKTYVSQFVFFCTGYFDHSTGYSPDFAGLDRFAGQVVHPQHWPEGLEYAGKTVVVIGSGATAVTLVPVMAETARHVTMLQRSPSYVVSAPSVDPVGAVINRLLRPAAARTANRWRWAIQMMGLYQFMRRAPRLSRWIIRQQVKAQLPQGYPVDVHFNPAYSPWDQRLCVVPKGDLFQAIRDGRADVVTDHINHFTETGIMLKSGNEITADLIVTATGFQLQALGGIDVSIDGRAVDLPNRYLYRGYMIEGVPNAAWTLGYASVSWTLKADLIARHVVRLLAYMDKQGHTRAVADRRGTPVGDLPVLALGSGYVRRAAGKLPKAGSKRPWSTGENYLLDFLDFKRSRVTESIAFSTVHAPSTGKKSVDHGDRTTPTRHVLSQ